jgi:quercetin dioxygenase-like cupin family protein
MLARIATSSIFTGSIFTGSNITGSIIAGSIIAALLLGCQAQHHSIGEAKREAQKHQRVRVRIEATVIQINKVTPATENPLAPQTVTVSDGTGTLRVEFLARDLERPLETGDTINVDIEMTAPWFLANDRTRERSPATAVAIWSISEG